MIFNFSGTGNSRWAANTLAASLKDVVYNIAEHSAATEFSTSHFDSIGFVFPVNGWMPPKIVRDFVRNLKVKNPEKTYCYVVMTAGDSIGEAMKIMRKDLNQAGLNLDAAFSLIMPESYVCLPGFNTDDPDRARFKQNEAARDLEIYTEYIIHKRKGVERTTKGPVPWVLTYILGIPFNKWLISDKPFKVDETRCMHCGKCAEVCPVKNIVWDNIPTWKKDGTCTNCMACYHNCPQHAINHRTTKNKGQYVCKMKVKTEN